MKAIGVSAPGATEVGVLDLPDPPPPGEGQLLIEVEAAGVGPWDRLLNTGGWHVGLRPPAALGVEGVGRVRAIGPGVQGISVGDRLVTHEAPLPGGSGFWAEEVLVTAAHTAMRLWVKSETPPERLADFVQDAFTLIGKGLPLPHRSSIS